MDSESYLEVRDAAITMVRGRTLRGLGDLLLVWGAWRAGTEERSLIPAWQRGLVPNSLRPHAGQGKSCAWPQGPLASPLHGGGPSEAAVLGTAGWDSIWRRLNICLVPRSFDLLL